MRAGPLLLVASAASIVSGSPLQNRDAPALPASAITKPKLFTFAEAQAGKDLEGKNLNVTRVSMAHLFQEGAAIPQSDSAASCSAAPGMRFEWRDYSQSDRLALMAAIRCLMNRPASGNFPPATNRYEDFVRLHQMWTPSIHANDIFVIWHRYYVWTFEQVLRSECGFDRAFPWWDAARDAGKFAQSDLFSQPYLGNLLPAQSNGQGWCINSGAFGGITLHIGPGTSNQIHCMTRAVNEQWTAECNQGYVDLCKSRGTYAEMASCLETGPHGYGHNGIGGVMIDLYGSPNDPAFWMIHLFVDHTYRVWQAADPARVHTINGNDAQGKPLTLDTVVAMGGIGPDVQIRDIIDTLGGVVIAGVPFCYKYNY